MDPLIALYQERLSLQSVPFARIDHEDAMVAIVYRGDGLILKVCTRRNDYLREVYFLQHFAGILPVPRILDVVPPEDGIYGAILMECLPGRLLQPADFGATLAYELGSCLARIHLSRVAGFGDLIRPDELSEDPCLHFTQKFDEGFAECSNHLPQRLLEHCRSFYDAHSDLLKVADGPCMVHRDFRPGNVIVHDGKLQGIIDWAAGRASFAQEDFCPLEHGEWPLNPNSKKAFLAGYSSIRPVPEYSAMMPLLRLSKAIATIGFTVKCGTWNSSHARVYQENRHFLDTFL